MRRVCVPGTRVSSRAAAVVGADGLIVEVHPCPEKALSDGNQSLTFDEFSHMMNDLQPFLDLEQKIASLRRNSSPQEEPISAAAVHPALAALLVGTGLSRTAVKSQPDPPPILYTVAKTYDALAWMHGGDRFTSGARIFLHDAKGDRPLLPDFTASADPAISFDGLHLLFSGKVHAQDPWQIWEIDLADAHPHRVTSGSEDCVRPFYLPDESVVYACKKAGSTPSNLHRSLAKSLWRSPTGRRTFFHRMFSATAEFSSRPDIRSERKLPRNSIRSTPMAAAWNRTVAITAALIIPGVKSVPAISCLPRCADCRDSLRRALSSFPLARLPESLPETWRRLPLKSGWYRGALMRSRISD